jgi:hypothetical protein
MKAARHTSVYWPVSNTRTVGYRLGWPADSHHRWKWRYRSANTIQSPTDILGHGDKTIIRSNYQAIMTEARIFSWPWQPTPVGFVAPNPVTKMTSRWVSEYCHVRSKRESHYELLLSGVGVCVYSWTNWNEMSYYVVNKMCWYIPLWLQKDMIRERLMLSNTRLLKSVENPYIFTGVKRVWQKEHFGEKRTTKQSPCSQNSTLLIISITEHH